jgi:hypothetical protein
VRLAGSRPPLRRESLGGLEGTGGDSVMPRWPAVSTGLGLALAALSCRSEPSAVLVPVPCAQGAWSGTGAVQLALQLQVSPSCPSRSSATVDVSGTGTFSGASAIPVVVTGTQQIIGLYFTFQSSDGSLTGMFNGMIAPPDSAVGMLRWTLSVNDTTVVGAPDYAFTLVRR